MRLLFLLFIIPAFAETTNQPFHGRWDLTMKTDKATFPSWIEVLDKDGQTQVMLQARESSVHPVPSKFEGGRLIITAGGNTCLLYTSPSPRD